MEAVSDSAALVMDDVIFAAHGRPNETLAGKTWVCDDASRVPVLARFCEAAIIAATKRDDCRWQTAGGMNFVKSR